MKMKYVRKLIIGSTALAFTAATLTTTTYAWLVMGFNSEFEEFEFTANSANGLQVSLDGTNFTQDLTFADISSKIAATRGVAYATPYNPVSLATDTVGDVHFDSNNKPIFYKDVPYAVNSSQLTDDEKANEITYRHNYVEATREDYIVLDVYFRLSSDGATKSNFNLSFTEKKEDNGKDIGFSSESIGVKLNNKMTTMTTTYNANDVVNVNPADAMRLGVFNNSNSTFKIYEQNIGLGSAAIEGATEDEHDPTKNAMYTYYNNVNNTEKFLSAAKDGNAFNTVSSYQTNPIHTFTYSEAIKGYNDVMISFYIWLEGWDADYFAGINPDSASEYNPRNIKINLGFKVDQVN